MSEEKFMVKRVADAQWQGDLQSGSGSVERCAIGKHAVQIRWAYTNSLVCV